MSIYESGEDYLERILMLQNKGMEVKSIDIVHYMNLSKPSVSVAMKKLKEDGYIVVKSNGVILLTESGRAIADKIYERHVFLTNLLVSIGVDEKTAAEDACKLEHDMSDVTFEAIKNSLKK